MQLSGALVLAESSWFRDMWHNEIYILTQVGIWKSQISSKSWGLSSAVERRKLLTPIDFFNFRSFPEFRRTHRLVGDGEGRLRSCGSVSAGFKRSAI